MKEEEDGKEETWDERENGKEEKEKERRKQ